MNLFGFIDTLYFCSIYLSGICATVTAGVGIDLDIGVDLDSGNIYCECQDGVERVCDYNLDASTCGLSSLDKGGQYCQLSNLLIL